MTEAELLFEHFCRERDIGVQRLREGSAKMPDYEIRVGQLVVAVEVKQLEPNTEDKKSLEERRQPGSGFHYENMERPRQSIRDATKQLRAHTQKRMPAVVVLFDTLDGSLGYLDSDNIAQCLYGAEQFHFAVPDLPRNKPVFLGVSLGGRRIATPQDNTTLSAVATLRFHRSADQLSLTVFHNSYAAVPIDPAHFRVRDVTHFAHLAKDQNRLPRWIPV